MCSKSVEEMVGEFVEGDLLRTRPPRGEPRERSIVFGQEATHQLDVDQGRDLAEGDDPSLDQVGLDVVVHAVGPRYAHWTRSTSRAARMFGRRVVTISRQA